MRSSIVCLGCGALSCSHEPFLDLSLPVPRAKRGGGAQGGASPCAMAAISGSPIVKPEDVLCRLHSDLASPHPQLRLGACLQAFGGFSPLVPQVTVLIYSSHSPVGAKDPMTSRGRCGLLRAGAPEPLYGENAYQCDKCKGGRTAKGVGQDDQAALERGQPAIKWLQVLDHMDSGARLARKTSLLPECVSISHYTSAPISLADLPLPSGAHAAPQALQNDGSTSAQARHPRFAPDVLTNSRSPAGRLPRPCWFPCRVVPRRHLMTRLLPCRQCRFLLSSISRPSARKERPSSTLPTNRKIPSSRRRHVC